MLYGTPSHAGSSDPRSRQELESRAGEEIRTPDVQFGKTRVIVDARLLEKPTNKPFFAVASRVLLDHILTGFDRFNQSDRVETSQKTRAAKRGPISLKSDT
jgi:hypothetical protein